MRVGAPLRRMSSPAAVPRYATREMMRHTFVDRGSIRDTTRPPAFNKTHRAIKQNGRACEFVRHAPTARPSHAHALYALKCRLRGSRVRLCFARVTAEARPSSRSHFTSGLKSRAAETDMPRCMQQVREAKQRNAGANAQRARQWQVVVPRAVRFARIERGKQAVKRRYTIRPHTFRNATHTCHAPVHETTTVPK